MSRPLAYAASLLVLSVAAAPAAFAQSVENDPATRLDEVVVTAARTQLPRSAMPMTVTLIDEAAIGQQTALGASAVETVAALTPSFSPTRQKLSGSGETLRGRSPLYLVDGVPQSTPLRDDARDGFTIDPFFIDRVEVIFGSNAIQGIGATGGVVNYVTAAPPREGAGFGGRAQVLATTDDSRFGDSTGVKAGLIGGQDFGRFDLTLGGAYETRGAYYDGEDRRVGFDGAQGELQDSVSWSAFAKAGMDLSADRRLELMINRFELEGDGDYVTVAGDRDTGLPASARRGQAPGIQSSNEVMSAALSYRDADVLGGTFRAQLYAHDYAGVFGGGTFPTFQDPAIAPIGTLFDQSANNSEKLGFKLDWEGPVAAVEGLRALVGLDGLRDTTYQELILTGRNWVPETTYESLAPFVQLNQRLMDGRMNLSGGLRYETVTLSVDDFQSLFFYGARDVDGGEPGFEELLVNVGATYEVVPGLKAYGSFAQGFNMADVGRVLRAINQPNQDIDTFLDISPVVTDNVELGLEWSRGPFEAAAAVFRSTAEKGSRLSLTPGGVYEVAREATEIEGIELTGRYVINDMLKVGAAYAHLEGRSDSNGDGKVDVDLDGANISPDRLLLWAEADWDVVSLRVQGQRLFERDFQGQVAENSFEGYGLIDVIGAWRAGFGDVSVGVQNLLDEQYVSYFSDTQAAGDDLRYFAGRGRTVTLGVTRRF